MNFRIHLFLGFFFNFFFKRKCTAWFMTTTYIEVKTKSLHIMIKMLEENEVGFSPLLSFFGPYLWELLTSTLLVLWVFSPLFFDKLTQYAFTSWARRRLVHVLLKMRLSSIGPPFHNVSSDSIEFRGELDTSHFTRTDIESHFPCFR